MMNKYNQVVLLILATILILPFSGCQRVPENEVTPLPSVTSKATGTSTPFKAVTALPLATFTKSVTIVSTMPSSATNTEVVMSPTLVPLPTLSPTEAAIRVNELIKTSASCPLPCWWGIAPSKTSWESAYQTLAPLESEEVYIYKTKEEGSFSAGFQIFVKGHKTIQEYIIRNNTVDFIEIRFGDSPSYTLSDLLTTYGTPEEVWISTIKHDVQGALPFELLLGYPSKGVLAYFQGMDAKVNGENVQKCFRDENAIVLDLWSPEKKEKIEQVVSEAPLFEGMVNFAKFQLLEATTEFDIKAFSEAFRAPNQTSCLNTPTKFWKSPFE